MMMLVLAATALVFAPGGIGFSTGIHKGNAPDPAAFANDGCTACHGDHAFAPFGTGNVALRITDAEGNGINGPYTHDAEYTITITLDEQNEPGAANRAGFNLRVDAGTLTAVDGSSQVTADGLEAAHVGAGSTEWTVGWTAPAGGAVVFDLWVNDVDGSAQPDAADHVYNAVFALPDLEGGARALPGAVEEHEPHVGVPLPQYWLGLIALAGMVFIMVFGYIYLKFVSPHNTDQRDR